MGSEEDVVEVKDVGGAKGLSVRLPNAGFVLVVGRKGYLMCGYLNMDTAERLGDAACMVSGVSTVDDALSARVKAVSSKARSLGISEGMTGREALLLLS